MSQLQKPARAWPFSFPLHRLTLPEAASCLLVLRWEAGIGGLMRYEKALQRATFVTQWLPEI